MKIIEIKNCSIYKNKKILDNFSLTIEEFEHTAIIGPNGSGKSTFISMLTRELNPTFGEKLRPEIKILQRDSWNIFEMRKIVSLVSPRFAENLLLAAPLSVIDAVASSFFGTYGFFSDNLPSKAQMEIVAEVLKRLDLARLKNSSIEELSTGELRKILIARSMVLQPKLILLDEPTSGLDISAQYEFLKYLRRLASQTTILMVTHHLEEVIPEIKKVLLIKNGRVFKFGQKEDILTEENLSELFGVRISLSISDGCYVMKRI